MLPRMPPRLYPAVSPSGARAFRADLPGQLSMPGTWSELSEHQPRHISALPGLFRFAGENKAHVPCPVLSAMCFSPLKL